MLLFCLARAQCSVLIFAFVLRRRPGSASISPTSRRRSVRVLLKSDAIRTRKTVESNIPVWDHPGGGAPSVFAAIGRPLEWILESQRNEVHQQPPR
uniref:Putative secreted protein n=1 Tax=Anopheles triannulatus TaxID=58253 RepID=A0A2M4B247_9DIPT